MKTYRWLTNAWKDAQHHSLLEKCKSKLQWDITSHRSEWPSSKSLQTINAGEGCGEKRTLLHCLWECKLIQPLWNTVWRFLKKLIKLSHDPAIPEKTEKDANISKFIAALFTIAGTWKQPRSPLTDEWIKKMWYIYTREYYSIVIRDEIGSFLQMIWMNLESVIQS